MLEGWGAGPAPCLPELHSRAGPGCGIVSEPVRGCEGRRAIPVSCLVCGGPDEGEVPCFSPLSLTTYDRWESCPQGHESERTGHVLHKLQHSGEQALLPCLGSRVELTLVVEMARE